MRGTRSGGRNEGKEEGKEGEGEGEGEEEVEEQGEWEEEGRNNMLDIPHRVLYIQDFLSGGIGSYVFLSTYRVTI